MLDQLGLAERPPLDRAGLNALYAAFSGRVPDDNIQKRIWFASDQTTPVTGGDPTRFFANWLAHGTGGTCWPINGALCTLLQSVGFDAHRVAGRIVVDEFPGINHGSVIVALDGAHYLTDGQIASFNPLPLTPGAPSRSGTGLHDISAEPVAGGFEATFYPGVKRETALRFRTDPDHDPVDHAFFLGGYDRSRHSSPFNAALYICRHYPYSILTVFRHIKIAVAADNTVTNTKISDADRRWVLIEELGVSEEVVKALPPDEPGARRRSFDAAPIVHQVEPMTAWA